MRTPAFSVPIMADVLLHEWENRAFPPHDAAYVTARPLAVAALAALMGALVFRRPGDLALDLEDLRDALRRARAFGIGCATSAGPGRAARLVPAAVVACQLAHLGPPPAEGAARAARDAPAAGPRAPATAAAGGAGAASSRVSVPEALGSRSRDAHCGAATAQGVLGALVRAGCDGVERPPSVFWSRPHQQAARHRAGFRAARWLRRDYAPAFGITRPDDGTAPQEIRLRFTLTQGRYVLGYPLHASLRVVTKNPHAIELVLITFDTHDLRMELLSYGPEIAVLVPPSCATGCANSTRRQRNYRPFPLSKSKNPGRLHGRDSCFCTTIKLLFRLRLQTRRPIPAAIRAACRMVSGRARSNRLVAGIRPRAARRPI